MPTELEPCDGHWSPQRKSVLLLAIDYRLIPQGEAATRFALSDEELEGWRRDYGAHGAPGLRATRLQCYRPERRKH